MTDDTSTMSISDTQAQLFGEPSGNNATIETSGRVIRPFMELPNAIVDEAKVEFAPDCFQITAVDPANVAMVDVTAHRWAFDGYDLGDESFTAGVVFDKLRPQLANARMGKSTDDDVRMEVDGTRTLVTTEREYDRTTLTQTNEVLNPDTDSIRQQPDLPDLNLPCTATVDVPAFVDALDSVKRVSNHAVVTERDGAFVIAGEGDDEARTGEYGTVADFGEIVEIVDHDAFEPGTSSRYSLDYFHDMAEALKAAKVDEVTVRWGDEFPVWLDFQRTIDDEPAYDGRFMLAPRIGT